MMKNSYVCQFITKYEIKKSYEAYGNGVDAVEKFEAFSLKNFMWIFFMKTYFRKNMLTF